MSSVSKQEFDVYKCDQINQQQCILSNPDNGETHQTPSNLELCDKCGVFFKNRTVLFEHINTEHVWSRIQQERCEYKSDRTILDLDSSNVHTEYKPEDRYVDEACEGFITQSVPDIRLAQGERSQQDSGFQQSQPVKNQGFTIKHRAPNEGRLVKIGHNMKSVKGEQLTPYSCPVCYRCFKSKGHQNRHFRSNIHRTVLKMKKYIIGQATQSNINHASQSVPDMFQSTQNLTPPQIPCTETLSKSDYATLIQKDNQEAAIPPNAKADHSKTISNESIMVLRSSRVIPPSAPMGTRLQKQLTQRNSQNDSVLRQPKYQLPDKPALISSPTFLPLVITDPPNCQPASHSSPIFIRHPVRNSPNYQPLNIPEIQELNLHTSINNPNNPSSGNTIITECDVSAQPSLAQIRHNLISTDVKIDRLPTSSPVKNPITNHTETIDNDISEPFNVNDLELVDLKNICFKVLGEYGFDDKIDS